MIIPESNQSLQTNIMYGTEILQPINVCEMESLEEF